MSISAISSSITAIGGKAALPGLGENLPESGQPLDFAALLAEQIPNQTDPAAPLAAVVPAGQQLDTVLMSGMIVQSGMIEDSTVLPVSNTEPKDSAEAILTALSPNPKQASATGPVAESVDSRALPVINNELATNTEPKGNAEAILAALSPNAKQASATGPVAESVISRTLPVANKESASNTEAILVALSTNPKQPSSTGPVAESDKKQERDETDKKAKADVQPVPTDPSLVVQYLTPPAAQAVQNRLPESVDRSKSVISAQISKANNADTPANEDRPALLEQARPVTSASVATSLAFAAHTNPQREPLVAPRSDTPNAAILAGDSSAGNSGSAPAFAAALATASTTNTTGTPPPPAVQHAVSTAFHEPSWPQDFGNRIVWLAKNDQQVAQININPPQLGPVQISISLSGDQVSAAFASPHPEVRQAIQDSLPQLRELFSSAGISLGQANVGTQLPSQNREAAYQFANEARSTGENAILSPDSRASSTSAGMPIQRGRGLVDLFA